MALAARYGGILAEKYSGPPRLLPSELAVNYGSGKVVFICHMVDLFANDVPAESVNQVLRHCADYPENTYVFQSKNPARFFDFLPQMPRTVILGTTIETNRPTSDVSKAPAPIERFKAMLRLRKMGMKIFVTVEPILQFDLQELADWIAELRPDFLNIGADSKGRGLKEPSQTEVMALVAELRKSGIEVREKENLERLKLQ
jgi:DNA repair photolyase